MYYNKNDYEMCNCHNYGFEKGLNRQDYGFANENEDWNGQNYGWNYYPDTTDLKSNDGYRTYDRDNDFDKNDRDYKEKDERDVKTCNHNRPCFRPCFSFFPCFNRRNIDCRNNRRCDCRETWENNCHDNDRKPSHNNTRLYFSGCIEFKNNDRKF